jgi:hypothetical protein
MSYSARVLRGRLFCFEVTVAALVLLTPAAYGVHEAQDLMYWTDSSSMNTDGELGGVRRASIEGGALVAEGQVEVWGSRSTPCTARRTGRKRVPKLFIVPIWTATIPIIL